MPRFLKRTDVRLGLICAAGAVVLGIGGLFGETARAPSLGPSLAIALVPPVEREVLPGETMEVGVLNDAFDRASLDRLPEPEIPDTNPGPAWVGLPMPWLDEPALRPVSPPAVVLARATEEPAPRPDPLADGSHAFGFDRPTPNYAAERQVRWEQRETAAATGNAPNEATPAATNNEVLPIKYSPE